jgi:hypothetical protein
MREATAKTHYVCWMMMGALRIQQGKEEKGELLFYGGCS